jgi:hypothetical protein
VQWTLLNQEINIVPSHQKRKQKNQPQIMAAEFYFLGEHTIGFEETFYT